MKKPSKIKERTVRIRTGPGGTIPAERLLSPRIASDFTICFPVVPIQPRCRWDIYDLLLPIIKDVKKTHAAVDAITEEFGDRIVTDERLNVEIIQQSMDDHFNQLLEERLQTHSD